jgi:hypothetical protein
VAWTQRQYLRHLLWLNHGCEYFRHHGLDSTTDLDEFRSKLPMVNYADLQPWIDRIAAGHSGVLTREPVRLFEPTSGTQAVKFIPYTSTLKAEYQRGVAAWVSNLYAGRPRLLGGKAYWSITPPPERARRTSGGIPIGFEDDAAYLSASSQWLVRQIMAVARPTGLEETLDALLHCPNLRLVSVWSPTMWLLLMERLQRDWQKWDRHPALRKRMENGLAGLWPQLDCLSCWGDGASAQFLPALRSLFPRLRIQPKGLLATEGFVSLPLWGWAGAALAVRCHFFEFVDEHGQCWLAHELKSGLRYEVLISTGGGLYRYRLGDLVEVVGYYGQCPMIRFAGRQGVVSDHFGEKLSPESISAWLPSTQGPCFVAYEGGRYVLFSDHPEPCLAAGEAHLLTHHHYRLCRQLGQLGPLAGYRLEGDAWAQFYGRLQALGMRPGDVKPQALRLEEHWSQWLSGRFVTADDRDENGPIPKKSAN